MLYSKVFYKSKTIQGAFVAILPTILRTVGIEVQDVEGIAMDILALFGAIWAVYGRFKAVDKVKV